MQPVVYILDFSEPILVQESTLDVALWVVLPQLGNNEEHLVVYFSRKLQPQEERYATIKKECLALK